MAFETGNPQFDFLMSRARNRRLSKKALEQNNINVKTSQEKREEESESENSNEVGSQVADISGLGASGVGTVSESFTSSIDQAQADIDAANAVGGSGSGLNAADVAFGRDMTAAQKDFAQSNPVGAAIAGFSTDAIAQTAVQTAPLGLAMAGQIEAAKAVANVGSVLGSPAFGMISGLIGPSMQDPMGNTVAMGSGMLGKVSQSLMSQQYSIAAQAAKGTPGYGMGNYGGYALGVSPGIFGGLTFTGVNAPDIHTYSPTDFMADIEEAKAYAESVEPFGGVGSTSIGGQGISVDSFSSPTEAAQNNTGYSSYGPTGVATGAAPPGSQFSSTGIFSSGNTTGTTGTGAVGSTGGLGGGSGVGTGQGSPNDGEGADSGPGGAGDPSAGVGEYKKGGKIDMQMGGDPTQQQAPSTDMGFIGGPPDQFTKQQTIADDIPKEVPEGTFVINAPAVEFAGKEDIKQMLVEAYEITSQAGTDAGTDRTAQATKIPSKEQVDIMISRGEVVVPPEIAKVIGYDRLEKINNRGKKEVSRRQEESQQQEKPQARQVAEGGFIDMQEGGNVEDDFGVTIENVKFKNFYSSPQIARKEIDKILNELPLEDALAIAMEGEADVLGDEGLEGVGHVFRNRAMAEGYKDFGNTLVEELGKKTYGKNKIFQFNALEPTKFRKTLNRFKQNKDRYLKVRNIAEDIVAGSRKDFTGGALFFKNPSSSEAQDFKSKVNSGEYVETGRTVNPKNKVFAHIYYKPKDFKVTDEMPTQVEESFVSVNNDDTQPPRKIPESTGGSFLGRGSAYETGGARPAFR